MTKKLYDLKKKYDVSIWLDNLDRAMTQDGSLQKLIDEGALGLTSNPSIFEKAISSGQYEGMIKDLKDQGHSNEAIYWQIAKEDVGAAADLFRPVYDETDGNDGYVSIEVSPLLARNTKATIKQAAELWEQINRPNIMIKVPATKEGLPAISELLSRGINVNVTLIFGPDSYYNVMKAYIDGVSRAHSAKRVRSVASVFISRVDSLVDSKLAEDDAMRGKAGIAQALQCYADYQDVFESGEYAGWEMAKLHGASPQRPLWASTGTKDPSYDPLMYVSNLLTPNSVNTVPSTTLEKVIQDAADWKSANQKNMGAAAKTIEALESMDVDMHLIYEQLEEEGVEKFNQAFYQLLDVIKRS